MKNIIIYWMRWTWKSTIWKLISQKLKYDFFDLDKSIEEYLWEKLSTFIDKNWWEKFREIENIVLIEILNINIDKVISLWWGTIIFENNRDLLLKKSTKLVYIESSLENITCRIINDEKLWNKRNSLTGKWLIEELTDIYLSRKNIYESVYDLKVENNSWIKNCVIELFKKINYWNICVPIVDFDKENLSNQISVINKSREIKFAELRIDFLKSEEIRDYLDILKTIKKQIIVTNRNILEWWKFEWWFDKSIEKLLILKDIWDYFDIELLSWEKINDLKNILKKSNKKLIISYHNFEKTPSFEEAKTVLFQMKKYNPEVYKIAFMPINETDIETIYQLSDYFQVNFDGDYIFISMWELGKETRVKIPKKWWLLSFWILNQASAPWQILYTDLYNKIFL